MLETKTEVLEGHTTAIELYHDHDPMPVDALSEQALLQEAQDYRPGMLAMAEVYHRYQAARVRGRPMTRKNPRGVAIFNDLQSAPMADGRVAVFIPSSPRRATSGT
jgi:hypothetical protein